MYAMGSLHDRDIREPLFEFLEAKFGKMRILEEKRMGKTRADVLMITEDMLYGFEIKSDADTYARLERQIGDYNRFCDRCFAVVGTKHAHSIKEHVPEWWGIITVERAEDSGEALDFYVMREPVVSPRPDLRRKLIRQMGFLWRPELNHLLEVNGLPKYAAKSKKFVVETLSERVENATLKRQCMDELFERDYAKALAEIAAYREAHRRPRKRRKKKSSS